MQYSPYGEIDYELNLGVSVNYLFTGQEFDREAGLYYYNARYYDPEIGRFIQPDTIIPDPSDNQAYNRYSYCRNNPIMLTDPSGHSWVSDVVGDFTEDVEDWVRDADPTEYFEDGIRAAAEGPQEFVEFHERMSRESFYLSQRATVTPTPAVIRPYVGMVVGVIVSAVLSVVSLGSLASAAPAISGAVSGFLGAFMSGGRIADCLKSTAIGAACGALTIGATSIASKSIEHAFTQSVVAGALSGAASGAVNSAAYGGNVLKGALVGAAMGAATAAAIELIKTGSIKASYKDAGGGKDYAYVEVEYENADYNYKGWEKTGNSLGKRITQRAADGSRIKDLYVNAHGTRGNIYPGDGAVGFGVGVPDETINAENNFYDLNMHIDEIQDTYVPDANIHFVVCEGAKGSSSMVSQFRNVLPMSTVKGYEGSVWTLTPDARIFVIPLP